MDGIRELLSAARDAGLVAGNFLGLLHIAIGRTVTRPDGSVLSRGVTWRVLAGELKALRFDPDLVRELGTTPDQLTARDRERYWYSAIALARVDSAEAVAAADKLVPALKNLGYIVGPPPSGTTSSSPSPTPPPSPKMPTSPAPKSKTPSQRPERGGRSPRKPG